MEGSDHFPSYSSPALTGLFRVVVIGWSLVQLQSFVQCSKVKLYFPPVYSITSSSVRQNINILPSVLSSATSKGLAPTWNLNIKTPNKQTKKTPTFLFENVWLNTRTKCSEKLWSLHPCRSSHSTWAQVAWATCFGQGMWARGRWAEFPSNLNHLCHSFILTSNRYMLSSKGWKGKTFFSLLLIWQQNVFPAINEIHQFTQECQIFKKWGL